MNYLVYKHTSPSGKAYIGITNNYGRRCWAHQHNKARCPAFYAAIQKYGWDNFLHEILYDNLSKQQACWREQQSINEHGSLAPYGYNLTSGGEIFTHLPETKAKISAANTGRKRIHSAEHRAKISAANKGRKKNLTEEQRTAIGDRFRGKPLSDTHKEALRKANTGRVKSAEAKAKQSATRKNRTTVISDETRQKLSDAAKKRIMTDEIKAKIGAGVAAAAEKRKAKKSN